MLFGFTSFVPHIGYFGQTQKQAQLRSSIAAKSESSRPLWQVEGRVPTSDAATASPNVSSTNAKQGPIDTVCLYGSPSKYAYLL